MPLQLTPTAQLRWLSDEGESLSSTLAALRKTFKYDWREGLFLLAAEKIPADDKPTLRYWQDLSARYLTGLCHLPESDVAPEVAFPSIDECTNLILTAPPMAGGEYLSEPTINTIWQALQDWVQTAVSESGSLSVFLQTRAQQWHQVGRVCFHLAENKTDEQRPFAFMATYATGFGTTGKLKHLPLHKALEQYAGAKNRAALINLLAPVQQAAENCDWVESLVSSGEIYQPMAWSAERAYQFLRSVPELESSGLTVRLPNWWRKRPRPQVAVSIGNRKQSSFGLDALLDFNVAVALGDKQLSRDELDSLLNSDTPLVRLKDQWVEVDREKLHEAIEHWDTVREQAQDGELSFIEGMRLLAGASQDLRQTALVDESRAWVHIEAGEAMRDLLDDLRNPQQLSRKGKIHGLQGTLRPYQHDGVEWLHFLSTLGLGACLADDMGLGKTIQVLALLLRMHKKSANNTHIPSLLIIPASLLGNWRSEAEKFAPALKLLVLHPAEINRAQLTEIAQTPDAYLAATDLVVTTYSMLIRQTWLSEQHWQLVILDEAQAIKTPSTRQSKAVKQLNAQARIALTGTPVENRLGDLWSIFDFLNPGLLGSAKVFQGFVKALHNRADQPYAPLRQLVAPYILRRLKTDRTVIADLPDKIETPRYCQLSKEQVKLYEQAVQALKSALQAAEGIARRGVVLQTMMRLKQICNHPSQASGDGDYDAAVSGKFQRLGEICEELAARQEKVLIFTQFREIIAPLAHYMSAIFGRSGLLLHGATGVKKRQSLVEQFQQENGPPFFILSLKAGGTGLNLTAASHVIHFDRWWNPAVENQATDRAFRIGQQRNVLVHTFITRGTVEERIDAMIKEKRQLADDLLVGDHDSEVNLTELPDDELLHLVRLDVTRAAL